MTSQRCNQMMKNETLKYMYSHAKFIKKRGDLNWCKSSKLVEVEKLAKLLLHDYKITTL
jgi:hypothetical protein